MHDPEERAASLALRDGGPGTGAPRDRLVPRPRPPALRGSDRHGHRRPRRLPEPTSPPARTPCWCATPPRWPTPSTAASTTTPSTADAPTVTAARGQRIAVGDLILTRRNDPTIEVCATHRPQPAAADPVRNGNRWQVAADRPEHRPRRRPTPRRRRARRVRRRLPPRARQPTATRSPCTPPKASPPTPPTPSSARPPPAPALRRDDPRPRHQHRLPLPAHPPNTNTDLRPKRPPDLYGAATPMRPPRPCANSSPTPTNSRPPHTTTPPAPPTARYRTGPTPHAAETDEPARRRHTKHRAWEAQTRAMAEDLTHTRTRHASQSETPPKDSSSRPMIDAYRASHCQALRGFPLAMSSHRDETSGDAVR